MNNDEINAWKVKYFSALNKFLNIDNSDRIRMTAHLLMENIDTRLKMDGIEIQIVITTRSINDY